MPRRRWTIKGLRKLSRGSKSDVREAVRIVKRDAPRLSSERIAQLLRISKGSVEYQLLMLGLPTTRQKKTGRFTYLEQRFFDD